MFKSEHHYRDFLAGAVVGGGLGAVTALMMLGNGKDVQKKLLKKYRMYKNQIEHFGETLNGTKSKSRSKKLKGTLRKAASRRRKSR